VKLGRFGRSAAPGWSVIDLETTGLYTQTDRIVEIAIIRLDADGRDIGAWTTLVDPERDIGASYIHGLRSRDLIGAPAFRDIANQVLAFISDSIVVGHNARFDLTFLHRECSRAAIPWGPIQGLCTMTTLSRLRRTSGRSLVACCDELGVALSEHHTAMADAQAVVGLLRHVLPPRGYEVPSTSPPWRWPTDAPRTRFRTDPPLPRTTSGLGLLASGIGVPDGVALEDDAAVAYLAVLDRVLEDRHLSVDEVGALAEIARAWNISAAAARELHLGYVSALWELAKADGVITKPELQDIEIVAELLGVSVSPTSNVAPAREILDGTHSAAARNELLGKSVCFTGDSVCYVAGDRLSRADQERLASDAGLLIKENVTGKLDVLVLADPDSQSGKAKRARDLGVRRIAEPVFWRMLGVDID
jgi:DNA polymerase-3 subunit epsilon